MDTFQPTKSQFSTEKTCKEKSLIGTTFTFLNSEREFLNWQTFTQCVFADDLQSHNKKLTFLNKISFNNFFLQLELEIISTNSRKQFDGR